MSIIEYLAKIFPFIQTNEYRMLWLALESAGRTTALYHKKFGEVITTIPTIGFNVETVEHGGSKLTIWDVGGCDKIRPLWRHYFQNVDVLFFFIDSTNLDSLTGLNASYSVPFELSVLAASTELRDSAKAWTFIANKQDLPNALSVDEIRQKLNLDHLMRDVNAPWAIFPTVAITGEGFNEAFDWTLQMLRNPPPRVVRPAEPEPPAAAAAVQPLEAWLDEVDEPDDVFLERFARFDLDSWNHRTHLRIAWLLLLRHGRRDGMQRIFAGIRAFIENSPRTKKNSFHESLTYFWVHMVHYAIAADAQKNGHTDFKLFLVLHPQLSVSALYLEYYSHRHLMQNPEARTQVVLPDLKPLPSLLVEVNRNVHVNDKAKEKVDAEAKNEPAAHSDQIFLADFEAGNMKSGGHAAVIRVIYLYLTLNAKDPKRRSAVIDRIFAGLRANFKQDFNFSLNYFWIQVTDFALRSTPDLDWSHFCAHHAATALNNCYWETFYSENVLFSPQAASEMVLPDLQPLPSIVGR